MARWFFIISFFFLNFYCSAEEQSIPLNFTELESFGKYADGQKVKIRGFLYQTKEGKSVLAAEPNLKTCCVGSQANIHKQIYLDRNFDSRNSAITVEGVLMVPDTNSEKYVLNDAKVIEDQSGSGRGGDIGGKGRGRGYLLAGGILGGLAVVTICRKALRRSRKRS